MVKKIILVVLSLVLLLVPAAACTTEDDDNGNGTGPPADPPADPIKIGIVVDLTGPLAAMGDLIRDGAKLAIEEINDAGGISVPGFSGKAEVQYFIEDGKTTPNDGFEAVKKLFSINGCQFILGPMISDASILSGPYALENKILLISPSATSPNIAEQDWRQFFFRTAPTDRLQGAAIAQLVVDEGYQEVAIMVMDNQYGIGIADVVEAELAGQATVVNVTKYDPTKADYLTELTIIQGLNPDVIVHTGYNDDSILVFVQAAQLGLDDIPWITSEGVYSPTPLAYPPAAQFMADALIGTRLIAPEGLAAQATFAAAYMTEYGVVPGVYCDAIYDAAMMIFEAIENVGIDTTAVAAEILNNVGQGFAGTSGTISFDEFGNRASADFEVWGVQLVGTEYEYYQIDVVSME